jgi:hypothetical protein
MPIECVTLEGRPVPINKCPKCGAAPFLPFIRGTVQRRKNKFFFFQPWDYCALICSSCKAIVGYESPPKLVFDSATVYAKEYCRICGERLALNPVLLTRHYAGFEEERKRASYHPECYAKFGDFNYRAI